MLDVTRFSIIISLIFSALICNLSFAEDNIPKNKLEFYQKYKHLRTIPTGPTDDPPPQPAIPVAEWEPATGVLVTYPLNIPVELVADMAEIVEIWSVVNSETNMQQALQEYLRAGIDTSNCHFLITGFWSTPWTRDFGPWYIFNGDGEQGIINNIYYGGIPCTQVPQMLGDTLGIPVYDTGLHAEGGNYMTDGMGNAITTTYTYWGNEPLTPDQIDGIFAEYLGIDNLVTVQHPWGSMVPHIDCHAKLLDPGRIIVIELTPINPIIEANVEYWSTLMSGYGRPYEILRVPGLGYANSLFLNDHVFVALSDNPIGDSTAVATFQEALPGYDVMGFAYPEFSALDALHCRTHEMADRYMLRIVHIPIHDSENTGSDYNLTANIHPYSNQPLVAPPQIYWKVEGGVYNTVSMINISGDDYEGYIPQQPNGTDIYYYIEAEDGSGRIENHPYIGPGNPHHFHVSPDNEPPIVEFHPPEEIYPLEYPLTLTAYALDNRWINSVTLEYNINGIPQDDVDMPLDEPYAVFYIGTTEGTVQAGDEIQVRVKAMDTSINQNTAYDPPTDYYTINVVGAPELLMTLAPQNPPIQIPGGGGSFNFDVLVENNETSTMTFDVWSEAILPNGSNYPLLLQEDINLVAGGSIFRSLIQNVPGNAPSGSYTYKAYIGLYPDTPYNEDSFSFEKLASYEEISDINNWSITGWDTPNITYSDFPTQYKLFPAYPNPFNPSTTIRFDLPEAGKVRLVVYDIQGREVSRLVNEFKNAGMHEINFDGSELASGIYFYTLKSSDFTGTKKIVLIK